MKVCSAVLGQRYNYKTFFKVVVFPLKSHGKSGVCHVGVSVQFADCACLILLCTVVPVEQTINVLLQLRSQQQNGEEFLHALKHNAAFQQSLAAH